MPGPGDQDIEFDAQDRAEVLDEDNYSEYGDERRTFEELDDVLDVTQARGDAVDDEALDAGEYDPDELGDDELEEDEDDVEVRMVSDDLSDADDFDDDDPGEDVVEGLDLVGDADRVEGGEDFTNFQAKGLSDEDIDRLGYGQTSRSPNEPAAGHSADDVEDNRDPETEALLDEGIEETFPASDPVSINPKVD